MRTRLLHLWDTISSGYWFVPAVMLVVAAIAAFVLLYVDRTALAAEGTSPGWLYSGGFDGAKTLLSVVAGSVITVAGVVFSITVSALSQAASQFGPRLLRNFMRDTGNQVVLGTFVATFLYCLLILRTLHAESDANGAFVPQASVTLAVVLAVASIVVLIYFIHHVCVSLQAPAVVAAVSEDLERVIARTSSSEGGAVITPRGPGPGARPPARGTDDAEPIRAPFEGYVQAIDFGTLVEVAEESDVLLRLNYRPGDHVIQESVLLDASPIGRLDDNAKRRIQSAFISGRHGTPEQDVEHAVRQLVEIAIRALSPGINDPFTAITCLNALGSAVCLISRCGLPGPCFYDADGTMRLVVPVSSFSGIVDTAFNQIRQYGLGSVAVTLRMLEVLNQCAEQITPPTHREVLLRHAQMVYADSANVVRSPWDRRDIDARWEIFVRTVTT